jgi:hypothetical protein
MAVNFQKSRAQLQYMGFLREGTEENNEETQDVRCPGQEVRSVLKKVKKQ